MPPQIGALISSDKASLYELETIYSVEDAYLMLEILVIDGHNRRRAEEHFRRKADG